MKRRSRRTPIGILKLRGTYRPDRHGGGVDIPASKPVIPRWLKGEARKQWQGIVPQLVEAGIVCRLDRVLLILFCHAWEQYLDIRKLRQIEPLLIKTTAGNNIQHPLVGMENRAVARLLKLAGELGLTPSSRAGLRIAPRTDTGTSTLAKFQQDTRRQDEPGPYGPKPEKLGTETPDA